MSHYTTTKEENEALGYAHAQTSVIIVDAALTAATSGSNLAAKSRYFKPDTKRKKSKTGTVDTERRKGILGFVAPNGAKGLFGKGAGMHDGRFKTRGSVLDRVMENFGEAANKMKRAAVDQAPYYVIIRQTTTGINSLDVVKNDKSRLFSMGGDGPDRNKGRSGGTGKGKKLELKDFTKEIMGTKPSNSPLPEKWYKKGGSISIDENGTWTYTNKAGKSVSYINRHPDFSEYYHPTVKPVEIEVASPTNRSADYKAANKKAGLNKDSDPPVLALDKPPEGYTWHHHEDGKTMVLVEKDIHREFTHSGGVSAVNGKNRQ
ncbi:HNH endonuclease [Paenibacillus humicus]|uniref:HNH endonuclease n=1 Tax=Paenibacillus humicus TaxID=412861 RepID=UPI003D296BEE